MYGYSCGYGCSCCSPLAAGGRYTAAPSQRASASPFSPRRCLFSRSDCLLAGLLGLVVLALLTVQYSTNTRGRVLAALLNSTTTHCQAADSDPLALGRAAVGPHHRQPWTVDRGPWTRLR